MNIKVLR